MPLTFHLFEGMYRRKKDPPWKSSLGSIVPTASTDDQLGCPYHILMEANQIDKAVRKLS